MNDTWLPGVDPYTGGANSPANASYFDHHTRPNASSGNPGRGYRFYTGTPVFAFGASAVSQVPLPTSAGFC